MGDETHTFKFRNMFHIIKRFRTSTASYDFDNNFEFSAKNY